MNYDVKKLLGGLEFLASTSAKAPADKQTHVACEAIYNDLKQLIESLESKPAEVPADNELAKSIDELANTLKVQK